MRLGPKQAEMTVQITAETRIQPIRSKGSVITQLTELTDTLNPYLNHLKRVRTIPELTWIIG